MATHPSRRYYLVDWIDLKGRTRETNVRALDAIEARATVTRNPDVQRIVSVTPMDVPE